MPMNSNHQRGSADKLLFNTAQMLISAMTKPVLFAMTELDASKAGWHQRLQHVEVSVRWWGTPGQLCAYRLGHWVKGCWGRKGLVSSNSSEVCDFSFSGGSYGEYRKWNCQDIEPLVDLGHWLLVDLLEDDTRHWELSSWWNCAHWIPLIMILIWGWVKTYFILYTITISEGYEYPFTSYLDVPWGPGTGETLKKLVLPVVKCLLVYKKMN